MGLADSPGAADKAPRRMLHKKKAQVNESLGLYLGGNGGIKGVSSDAPHPGIDHACMPSRRPTAMTSGVE